jgi:hypothetical protein
MSSVGIVVRYNHAKWRHCAMLNLTVRLWALMVPRLRVLALNMKRRFSPKSSWDILRNCMASDRNVVSVSARGAYRRHPIAIKTGLGQLRELNLDEVPGKCFRSSGAEL